MNGTDSGSVAAGTGDLRKGSPKDAVQGIVFDKDGTLIDFRGTWDRWARDLIVESTGTDQAAAARLAEAMWFDLENVRFRPGSPIIAGTAREAAELVAAGLGRSDVREVALWLDDRARIAPMAPVVPLRPFCAKLKAAGLALGIATNDAEAVAHAHVESLGLDGVFDYIAGYDSGHGAKPDPGMVQGFCAALDLTPARCLMVGDSPHDMIAGAAAGVRPIAVLTGVSEAAELAPFAEAVLPDIGHLPAYLRLSDPSL